MCPRNKRRGKKIFISRNFTSPAREFFFKKNYTHIPGPQLRKRKGLLDGRPPVNIKSYPLSEILSEVSPSSGPFTNYKSDNMWSEAKRQKKSKKFTSPAKIFFFKTFFPSEYPGRYQCWFRRHPDRKGEKFRGNIFLGAPIGAPISKTEGPHG